MPRHRPPGAGSGLRTTTAALLTFLIVLPWISTAAQQQQSADGAPRLRSPSHERDVPSYVDAITRNAHNKARIQPKSGGAAAKQNPYTPLISQNERAVATKVSSAPADFAVRAPPARNAAASGGLTLTPHSARSLQDWEVEDFVLLATVDGRLHARDRYNGDMIWTLETSEPMVHMEYNRSHPRGESFMFIVEPKENGELYTLTPGPQPQLVKLGLTVKNLAEELAPFSSETDSLIYLAEKKNTMFVLDARNGDVAKLLSPTGSMARDHERCVAHQPMFDDKRRECKGFFNIGRTKYTISVQDRTTAENICTITYYEWVPNNRDRDLHAQYLQTMDSQYIYTRYDGHAIAVDHKRSKAARRPVFEQWFESPVVRVFDVARPTGNEDDETNLILLPQPPGPGFSENKATHVWLNTTEDGSWYAMSEATYPAVTDQAPTALCYTADWNDIGHMYSPYDRYGLVGVHYLQNSGEIRQGLPGIEAPPSARLDTATPIPGLPSSSPPGSENISTGKPLMIEGKAEPVSGWNGWVILVILALSGLCFYLASPNSPGPFLATLYEQFSKLRGRYVHSKPAKVHAPLEQTEPQTKQENGAAPEVPITIDAEVTSAPTTSEPHPEKKVRFEEVDDENDMAPLSRTTTAEQPFPSPEDGPLDANGQPADPATPTKKKKAHRGRRGGAKKNKNPPRDNDDVDVERSVNAARELEPSPTLHPDAISADGDIQGVSSIKKIGKLTIDFDRSLGTGSGGTVVYEGKWHEREVAVKRMLARYFGLAQQEVKLLQDSEGHKNVIRYFDHEQDDDFLYIAVELCQASLYDLYRDGKGEPISESQEVLRNEINVDVTAALSQLAQGLDHLHSLRVIHRDIKPHNILIANPGPRAQSTGLRLVISDFGLCKTLPDNMSTLAGTTNAGTAGWKAPELIFHPKDFENKNSSAGYSKDSANSTDPVVQGVKRAVDIFSLGCVFFYVLTNGSHPFDDQEGWTQMREYNIKKDKSNFERLSLGDDSEEPRHLIQSMLAHDPKDRPTAFEVKNHPFFWPPQKRLDFLCDCSDHWEREPRDPPSALLIHLESFSAKVIGDPSKKQGGDFLAKLHRSFVASLGKQRKYTGDRMLDLLRALRNKKNHYEDMDENTKALVGELPRGYLNYWTIRFPSLLLSCYQCVKDCKLEDEPRFRRYFNPTLEQS